jgi:hypothetical protein
VNVCDCDKPAQELHTEAVTELHNLHRVQHSSKCINILLRAVAKSPGSRQCGYTSLSAMLAILACSHEGRLVS